MSRRGSRAWLWTLVAFMFLSQTGLNIARPQMSYKLIAMGASASTIGVVTAAYAIVPVFAAIAMGRLAERIRRLRAMVLVGGALIAAGTALLAVAGSIPMIALASTVFGMGHLVCQIASQSSVSRYSTDSGLDAGFGWTTAGLSAGQLVGPLVGGWILSMHADPSTAQRLDDVSLASWIGAGFALLALPLMLWPVTLRRAPAHTEQLAAVDSTAAIELAEQDASRDAGKATTLGILRLPGVASHIVASMAMLAIMDILTAFLPLVGEDAGVAPFWVGAMLAARSLASIISRSLISVLSRRGNRTQLVIASLLIGALTVAAVPPVITHLPLAFALLLVGGFFIGLAQPLTMTMIVKTVPLTWRSPALAVRLTGNRVGQVVIPVVAGFMAAPLGPAGAIWFTCALLLASAGEKTLRRARTGITEADV